MVFGTALMDKETKRRFNLFLSNSQNGQFPNVPPQSIQFIFCSYSPFLHHQSFKWSTGCIFWHAPLLLRPHLCQHVKQLTDELKFCLPALRPAVKRREWREGGRGKSICLSLSLYQFAFCQAPGSNPIGLLPKGKGQVNKCVCGLNGAVVQTYPCVGREGVFSALHA